MDYDIIIYDNAYYKELVTTVNDPDTAEYIKNLLNDLAKSGNLVMSNGDTVHHIDIDHI
jgi:NDP-sugar pyrophosphorylase family protein